MKSTFAKKDGRPVHVSEVERGLKCGCVCSACGHPLQARKGSKVRHYFAHHVGSECSLETVIHHTAKQIIIDAGEIHIPATEYSFRNHRHIDLSGQVIPLSNIHDEENMGSIRPDVIGYYKGKPLLIEVYVTHKVDNIKVQKIKDKGISAIEIDLSGIGYETGIDALKQLVLYESTNREWINNERTNAIYNHLLGISDKKSIFRCTRSDKVKIEVLRYIEMKVEKNWENLDLPLQENIMQFVLDCPKYARSMSGESFAMLLEDCFKCEYALNVDFECLEIACTGRTKITTFEHFKDYCDKYLGSE